MEKSMLRLAAGIAARGHSVEIVVGRRHGELKDHIPTDVSICEIGEKSQKKKNGSIRACLFRAGLETWPFIFNKNLRKLRPFQRLIQLPAFTNYFQRNVRLVILGAEGFGCADYVREVHRLAGELRVANDIFFPGFVANPFVYMARAALFVLSSIYEGLPGVLIQALACGCPVVSTDCPSGPREILEQGRYGLILPVGDDQAMADAIKKTLDQPLPQKKLHARGAIFSVDNAVDGYLGLLLQPANHVGIKQGDLVPMAT